MAVNIKIRVVRCSLGFTDIPVIVVYCYSFDVGHMLLIMILLSYSTGIYGIKYYRNKWNMYKKKFFRPRVS